MKYYMWQTFKLLPVKLILATSVLCTTCGIFKPIFCLTSVKNRFRTHQIKLQIWCLMSLVKMYFDKVPVLTVYQYMVSMKMVFMIVIGTIVSLPMHYCCWVFQISLWLPYTKHNSYRYEWSELPNYQGAYVLRLNV